MLTQAQKNKKTQLKRAKRIKGKINLNTGKLVVKSDPKFNDFVTNNLSGSNISKYQDRFKTKKTGNGEKLTHDNLVTSIRELFPMIVTATCTLQIIMIHGVSKYNITKEYVDNLNKNLVQFIENSNALLLAAEAKVDLEDTFGVMDSLVGNIFEIQNFTEFLVSPIVIENQSSLDGIYKDIVERFKTRPEVNINEVMYSTYIDSIWDEHSTKGKADDTVPTAVDEEGAIVDVEEITEEQSSEYGFGK